jgi:hypothetical protein
MSAMIFATTSLAFGFAEESKPAFFVLFFVAVLGQVRLFGSWREKEIHGIAITD